MDARPTMDPLFHLLKQLDVDAVKSFLSRNAPFADPNALVNGHPVFSLCLECPEPEATACYFALVQAGCDPLLPYPGGSSPLNQACARGFKKVLVDLLARGADPTGAAPRLSRCACVCRTHASAQRGTATCRPPWP